MNSQSTEESIRVLIADDDEHILACYREAFGESEETDYMKTLDALDAELFDVKSDVKSDVKKDVEIGVDEAPRFDIVECSQGQDAIDKAREAANDGHPFDVVILDVRMPPGIDGVEAGSKIREFDSEVQIVFVTGFSDVPRRELERRVPPPRKLHYFNKPLSFMRLAKDVAGMIDAH